MKNIFNPAMFVLNQMRYPMKFGIIFMIVLVPLISLGYSMVSIVNEEVNFIQNERNGLSYIKVIRQPIEHMQQHRGMTAAYLNGASEFKSRIMSKRQDVDKHLRALEAIDREKGAELGTGGTVANAVQQWENIKANSLNMKTAEAIKAHSKMIADLMALMVEVADNSQITLDPVLDSYYMGAALVITLPNMIENMGQARAVGSSVAAKGTHSGRTFTRLSVLSNSINVYARDLKAGMDAIAKENPEAASHLGPVISKNQKAIEEMQDLLEILLKSNDNFSVDGKTAFDTATHAIADSYDLYDSLEPELDKLFDHRIDSLIRLEVIEAIIIVAVLLIIFYLFVGLYMSITNNIGTIGEVTRQVATGDLTARMSLHTRDEMQQIAHDFNGMAETVEALVQQISSATTQLAAAAEEMSAVSSDSDQNIKQQTAEIDQVATAMNEMTATVQEVANNASSAAGAAVNADNEARGGKEIVTQTSDAIMQLASSVEQSADVIHQLEIDSDNIGTVLDVIKSIAEQTNLLALNAAIEAARAGEQGRGFAVVADEVRTLASRTQESTNEIQEMIEKLQSGSRNAVSVMEQGRSLAQSGVEQAKEAAESLDAITRAVSTINEMNTMIASASEEQSSVANDMNESIVKINELSQNTASGAEQSSSSSSEMANLASQLQSLVSHFKT